MATRNYKRTDRVADQIQRELAQLIAHQVKDPRVGMVTITGVDVTREFDHAKIHITVMGADEEAIKETLTGLRAAAGFLRRELGRAIRIRTIPQLHFMYDESIEYGVRLSSLIEKAVKSDSRVDEDVDTNADSDASDQKK